MIFFYFSSKPYVVTPHLNCLAKVVQIRGQDMCLCRINKNYPLLSPNIPSNLEFCAQSRFQIKSRTITHAKVKPV